jgi:DNA repair protein RadC
MVKFELKRLQTEFPAVKINNIKDAEQVVRKFYGDDIEIFESCFILLLNNSNLTIGYAKISQGGITGTVVDTRIVAKYAIESLATGVILAHNHPSGNLNCSNADIQITKKIREGLQVFDIQLLDSMIITKDGYSSVE